LRRASVLGGIVVMASAHVRPDGGVDSSTDGGPDYGADDALLAAASTAAPSAPPP